MAEQVYMDIPAVKNISTTFGTISDTLKTVAKTLEALANVLKTTAFVGMVGGAAIAHVIDTVKPYIQQMADKCAELKKDVLDSVLAYERGDAQGATRFF
ncbi:MAG: hypothetical protein CVU38_17610 [Chloroflexi bacterium HGW-Chloroflexi-1]|nr:MAG: hypothetical protein CVU38_17610 [Chloroflexi bacterium HGW-Chloroflexi-1]